MPFRFGLLLTIVSAIWAAACADGNRDAARPAATPLTDTPEEHRAAVDAWRRKHEADYGREYATIAGLYPLKAGVNTAGSGRGNAIPLPASTPATLGRFVLERGSVRFEPEPGVAVSLRDQPVVQPVTLHDDSTPEVDELVTGDVGIVVHLSGDTLGIRVRDPNSAPAKAFVGFTWFDFDPKFRVIGRFIPDTEPRRLKVQNTYGDLDEYTTEGVVEFEWGGQTVRLRPFTTRPKRLYFVFRDAAAGQETYAAARFLYADLGDDGSVVLDFNMAYNPPCSFNPYTTCPIPLPENRLAVKILAGEKKYPVDVPLLHTGA